MKRRCSGRSAIFWDIVGARSILHGTHVETRRSIRRRPPTGQNPSSLMRAEEILRPWWWVLACRYPSRASPLRVSGTRVGCFRPKERSERLRRPPTLIRPSVWSRNGLLASNSVRFLGGEILWRQGLGAMLLVACPFVGGGRHLLVLVSWIVGVFG